MTLENLSHELQAELETTGVVYLLELGELERMPHRFVGYWEAELDSQDEIIQSGPGWDNEAEAVAWGKQRASVVVLSCENGHTVVFD